MAGFLSVVAVVFAATLTSGIFIGCGGEPEPAQGERASLPGLQSVEGGGVRISPATLEVIGSSLSEYERSVLADYVLSLSEYEVAYLESVRCAEQLGYTVTDRRPPTLVDAASFGAVRAGPPNVAIDEAFKYCKTQFLGNLTGIWSSVHRPTEADLQLARQAIGKCLQRTDPTAPNNPTSDELMAYLRTAESAGPFAACKQEAELQFGFALR